MRVTRPTQRDPFAAEVHRVHAEVNDQTRLMGKKFETDPAKIAAFEFRADEHGVDGDLSVSVE
jgi:hypothetical protein